MALSDTAQEVLALGLAVLPPAVVAGGDVPEDLLRAQAAIFGAVRDELQALVLDPLLDDGSDAAAEQLARELGNYRQLDEDIATLRARAKVLGDAVTPVVLLRAVNAVLDAAGHPPTATLLELPWQAMYLGRDTAYASRGYRATHSRRLGFAITDGRPLELRLQIPRTTSPAVRSAIVDAVNRRRVPGLFILLEETV
jgi:hypothetical protein